MKWGQIGVKWGQIGVKWGQIGGIGEKGKAPIIALVKPRPTMELIDQT